jgi:hypothetical protein
MSPLLALAPNSILSSTNTVIMAPFGSLLVHFSSLCVEIKVCLRSKQFVRAKSYNNESMVFYSFSCSVVHFDTYTVTILRNQLPFTLPKKY